MQARTRASAVGVGLAALGTFLHARLYDVRVDDAYIAFRYAENFASGRGLVFNDGERVEGYTDFAWVVLLAVAKRLGADVPAASSLFGIAAGVLLVPIVYVAARRCLALGPAEALWPCAIVASSSALAMWAGSGLETTLYTALVTAAIAATVVAWTDAPRVSPIAGVVWGLAALTRPEAIGLLVAAATLALLKSLAPRRAIARVVGTGAIFIVPHFVFRRVYYGLWLPNTFYAKTSNALPLRKGIAYVGEFLLAHGFLWALLAIPALLAARSGLPRAARWLPPALLAVALAYVTVVGGDFYPFHRFCLPYLPWLTLVACGAAAALGERIAPLLQSDELKAHARAGALGVLAASVGLASWFVPDALHAARFEDMRTSGALLESYGRRLGATLPRDALIAVSALGYVPYFSGLRTLDMLGLADRHISHARTREVSGKAGHQKYDSDYVLGRRPLAVVLEFGDTVDAATAAAPPSTGHIVDLVLQKPHWPAIADLLARSELRLRYAPRSLEVQPGVVLYYFIRDDELAAAIARVPLDGPDARAHLELALALRTRGLFDEALQRAERAASLAADDPRVAVARGEILLDLERFGEAAAQFEAALRLAPRDASARMGLALAREGAARSHAQERSGSRATPD